jgi:hypothetical protein
MKCTICHNECEDHDNRCDDCKDLPVTEEERRQGQTELCDGYDKHLTKQIEAKRKG